MYFFDMRLFGRVYHWWWYLISVMANTDQSTPQPRLPSHLTLTLSVIHRFCQSHAHIGLYHCLEEASAISPSYTQTHARLMQRRMT